MASIAARRLLSRVALASGRRCGARPLSASATASSPPPPHPPPPPSAGEHPGPQDLPPRAEPASESAHGKDSTFEAEQARVLRAALLHVPKSGWSELSMIAGARDAGVSPSVVGAFPRKEAALVEFFMDDCLQKLMDRIEAGEGEQLKNMILSERLSRLIRMRLEMHVPYISKWPQALGIQSQPQNIPTSLKQRAVLVDEMWHAAGEVGSDIDWYVKRTVLGGIYSTSEVYMITDNSPEFRDTWSFVNNRVKDAVDLQKTFKEFGYLAEAVGAGMGGSMQGFLKNAMRR